MSIITISKEYACDTRAFASQLADKLGYSILDKLLGSEAAGEQKAVLREHEEIGKRSSSHLLDLLSKYTAAAIQGVIDRSYRRIDEKAYHELASSLVLDAAQQDNVVIVGWGGQCILKDHSRAVHLRIVKKLEDRIAWLKLNAGMSENDARDLIEHEELESAGYIRHHFNQAWDDAHLYHLTLNLSKLSLSQAVSVVVDLVE